MRANVLISLGCMGAGLGLCVSTGRGATGTIQDVQHVIILSLENRSFDHAYGTLKGVRGFGDANALTFTNGSPDFYQPNGLGYVLPFHITNQCLNDLPHYWADAHAAWNGGRWNQWVPYKGTTTMVHYRREDLPFYYSLADAYTICDAYYCSVLGPTEPNRLYMMTGTIDAAGADGGPATNNIVPAGGFTWTTYPERLQAAGVSWKVYQQSSDFFNLNPLSWFAQYKQAPPGSPLRVRGVTLVTNLLTAFEADITNGTLPKVSWLLPPWSMSEHPFFSPSQGQVLVNELLQALAAAPSVFDSTVFILTYDENGGLFDHIPPPVPPPGTAGEFVNGLPIGLGARVPMLLISPWTRGGYVCSQVFDHTSILRFLEAWTGAGEPNISGWRRQICGDLTSAFDFKRPVSGLAALPVVAGVICTNGGAAPAPSTQVIELPEPGTRPARLLPYQPNANAVADCAFRRLCISFTNAGQALMQFAVYPNAYRNDGPWHYDVPAQGAANDCFAPAAAGLYDLTCYGPNGFQRRFAGNLNTNCGGFEATSILDLDAGGIILSLANFTTAGVIFTVTNASMANGLTQYNIPAGTTGTAFYPVATNQNGWYDLAVTASADRSFLRRLAGHLEIGPPNLYASASGETLVITYPGWATGYTLESRTELVSGAWSTVTTPPAVSSNRAVVTLPLANPSSYFRLRQ